VESGVIPVVGLVEDEPGVSSCGDGVFNLQTPGVRGEGIKRLSANGGCRCTDDHIGKNTGAGHTGDAERQCVPGAKLNKGRIADSIFNGFDAADYSFHLFNTQVFHNTPPSCRKTPCLKSCGLHIWLN